MQEKINKDKSILEYCKYIASKISLEKVDEYEVYGSSSIHNEIEVFNGSVENLSFSDSKGIGIRVFKDGRMGYSYTSMLEEEKIRQCIEKAIINSRITAKDNFNSLPKESEFKYKKNNFDRKVLFSEKFSKYSVENKIEILKNLEIIAKKKDKRITNTNNLIYDDSLSEIAIINSTGFMDSFKSTSAFIYLNMISKEGSDTSTGDYFGYERDPGKFNLEEIATNAVKRSVLILSGKKIKSQVIDILLDPLVAVQFLEIIASVITADVIQKGKSLFKDKIGEKVFSNDFNIIDDGMLPYGLASRPFDGEGVPKGKTIIFEKGILKTYLYNTYTARKDNQLSTGNAARTSYKSPPDIGISNFYIEPSNITFEKLLESIDKGFYVIDIIGLHSGTNTISGQISVGAKGLMIDKGSLSFPVKEVTIATDILSFCKNISKIGKDIKFMPSGGYVGSPSMLIKDVTISGN